MENTLTTEALEAALRRLPEDEYGALLPRIRQIVVKNLQGSRVERFLAQDGRRSLDDYVRQVAQVVKCQEETPNPLFTDNADEAWNHFQKALRRRAYYRLIGRGVDHAEAYERANDLAQQACCAIIAASYPGDVPYTAWAKRILDNLTKQDIRRRGGVFSRTIRFSQLQVTEGEDEPEPVFLSAADPFDDEFYSRQALKWAVRQLRSEAQRCVLQLQCEGWSDGEIAKATGRSVGAVHLLRHRAIRHLQRLVNTQA